MLIELTPWLAGALNIANRSMAFMLWNTFLALIPFVLSLWLFRTRGANHHQLSWWIGFIVFMAFLPNAPYVLTDVIHLVRFIREGTELWTVVLVLIPQYLIFMLVGTEAYVASLVNLGHYCRKQGLARWILPAEIVIHALCAVGIYLGRFPRFNSWDIVTGPHRLAISLFQALLNPQAVAIMIVTFVVIATIYWPLKQITLAMLLYIWSKQRQRAL